MNESHRFTLPAGFRELHGDAALRYRGVENLLLDQLRLRGFDPCQISSLEYIDLYHPDRIGVDPFSNLILGRIGEWRTFSSHSSEDPSSLDFEEETNEVALRPELTAPLVRSSLFGSRKPSFPMRVCSSGRIFQDLDPLRQLKERGQVDAEILGLKGTAADAEILCLCHDLLKTCGIERFSLHAGHAELFEHWIISCGVIPEQASSVLMAIRRTGFLRRLVRADNEELNLHVPWMLARMKNRFDRMVNLYDWLEPQDRPEEFDPEAKPTDFSLEHWRAQLPELQQMLVTTAWRHALHLSDESITEALNLSKLSGNWEEFLSKAEPYVARCEASRPLLESFREILETTASAGVEVDIDPPPGKGFSYYNGLTFEARVPEEIEAIARGGRYDSLVKWLVQRSGPSNEPESNLAAVGMAIDLETLLSAIERNDTIQAPDFPRVSILAASNRFSVAYDLMRTLNQRGISCRLDTEKTASNLQITVIDDQTFRFSEKNQTLTKEELLSFLTTETPKP